MDRLGSTQLNPVARVGARPEQIFGLAELARKWGWQNETLDLWWLAAKNPTNTEITLRMLYHFYAARRDTRELYRVLAHLEKARPSDRAVRNNLAQISLLLNLNAEGAHRLAREVYEQEPKNADYAATYAFSLFLEGDVKKALQIFAGFSEAEILPATHQAVPRRRSCLRASNLWSDERKHWERCRN